MKDDNAKTKVDLFKNSHLFVSLDDNELRKLAELSMIRRFAKGEIIFMEGDPVDFLFFLAEGRVKIFKSSASGRIFTILIAARGDPIVSHHPSNENTRCFSSKALDNVVTVCVERDDFINCQLRFPKLGLEISRMFGRLLSSAYDRILDLIEEDVEQRLTNVLYILYSKFGPALSFTSEELSDLAGTTTATTIRILAKLRKAGLVRTGRGRISVLDGGRLQQRCRCSFIL